MPWALALSRVLGQLHLGNLLAGGPGSDSGLTRVPALRWKRGGGGKQGPRGLGPPRGRGQGRDQSTVPPSSPLPHAPFHPPPQWER